MRKKNHRKRSKSKTACRKMKNVAQIIRALLLEGLGAAVLIFLFMTTRFTPEQLQEYSFFGHNQDQNKIGHEQNKIELDQIRQFESNQFLENPVAVSEDRATAWMNEAAPQATHVQMQSPNVVLDLNARYQAIGHQATSNPAAPLQPSWQPNNYSIHYASGQGIATNYSSRRSRQSPRTPRFNW